MSSLTIDCILRLRSGAFGFAQNPIDRNSGEDAIVKRKTKIGTRDAGRETPNVNLKVFKMEEYGKIFVVVTVLAFILVGIFAYLFTIDRKLRKLEKEIEQKSAKNEK